MVESMEIMTPLVTPIVQPYVLKIKPIKQKLGNYNPNKENYLICINDLKPIKERPIAIKPTTPSNITVV